MKDGAWRKVSIIFGKLLCAIKIFVFRFCFLPAGSVSCQLSLFSCLQSLFLSCQHIHLCHSAFRLIAQRVCQNDAACIFHLAECVLSA